MKSCKYLHLLVFVFLAVYVHGSATPLHAAVHDGIDILGLATIPDETGEFTLVEPALGAFDLYLLAYGFDHSQGIVGWECQIVLPNGIQSAGVTLNGKADPSGVDESNLNIQVFPRIPLQANNGIVHLATLHLVLMDLNENKEIFLAPFVAPSASSTMNFSLETSGTNVFEFNWPGDCPDCPVFEIFNSPQPTVEATWDLVKSLYR